MIHLIALRNAENVILHGIGVGIKSKNYGLIQNEKNKSETKETRFSSQDA